MASQSEVGHARNVANLQKLIEQITVYPLYNPHVENLTVTSLQTLPPQLRRNLPKWKTNGWQTKTPLLHANLSLKT